MTNCIAYTRCYNITKHKLNPLKRIDDQIPFNVFNKLNYYKFIKSNYINNTVDRELDNIDWCEISISYDYKILAIATTYNEILLFNSSSFELLLTLKYHYNDITNICFSYQNNLIASTSRDTTIVIYDIVNKQIKHRLKCNKGVLYCEFSPNGKILASGGFDKTVSIWHIESGTLLNEIKCKKYVIFIDFSLNNDILAFSSFEHLYTCKFKQINQIYNLKQRETNGKKIILL